MSIAVEIDDLPAAIEQQIGWCYLLSVTDAGQARVVAIAPQWVMGGVLQAEVGGRTAANVSARPEITLVFPPATADGYSLIVDGTATVAGNVVLFEPFTAVLHRPAIAGTGS